MQLRPDLHVDVLYMGSDVARSRHAYRDVQRIAMIFLPLGFQESMALEPDLDACTCTGNLARS